MTAYEMKKLQVEYKRVNAAREEQELRVLEMMDHVQKIQISIDASIAKEEEILAKIEQAKKEE